MSTETKPRLTVSVIIPTYNRASLIGAAVESVLAQSRRPEEILVVDDGSTDDTSAVLARFGDQVRVIRQVNSGRSVARNTGLRKAQSDAVMFLDSDDLLTPRAIELCAAALEAHGDVDVVYGDARLINGAGDTIGLYSQRMPGVHPTGWVLGELGRRCFLTISTMVRRSALQGIAFDESMECGEDYDFWRQLAAHSRFFYVDQPLMCYRFHAEMTVTSRVAETLDGELVVQDRVMRMPEFANVPRKEQARVFCAHGAKQAMRGRASVARKLFWKAIRYSPLHPEGYVLAALSLFSLKPLQYAISKRRRMIGNEIAADVGEVALAQQRTATEAPAAVNPAAHLQTPPTVSINTRDTVAITREPVHG